MNETGIKADERRKCGEGEGGGEEVGREEDVDGGVLCGRLDNDARKAKGRDRMHINHFQI